MEVVSKVVILTFISILLLVIGYHQYLYVINFTNTEMPLLILRKQSELSKYQIPHLVSGKDPRLYSMVFYGISTFSLILGFIKIFFKEKKYVIWTIWIYLGAYLFGLMSLMLFYFLSKGSVGAHFFQKIKNSLSSPFILCFLIPLFLYSNKTQNKA